MAKTESVEIQMRKILEEYDERVQEVADKAAEEAAKQAARTLKSTSPKRPGHGKYARTWTAKREGKGWIVHNSKHYQLTHLLENGHVVRNKCGTYGRAPAIKHIEPVEQSGIQDFEERISRGLS